MGLGNGKDIWKRGRKIGWNMAKGLWRKGSLGCVILLLAGVLTGCSAFRWMGKTAKTDKIRDLEFTVVGEERQPEELKQALTEKKREPFKMTYSDEDYLYICIGYGEQKTGGYSIAVKELYLTENTIYVDTELLGPPAGEKPKEGASCPYIVIKAEFVDKSVVFN